MTKRRKACGVGSFRSVDWVVKVQFDWDQIKTYLISGYGHTNT